MGKYSEYIGRLKNDNLDFIADSAVKNPKISIIIPAYNVENYIEICLTSVIRQALKEIEIIIIDDGSTDFTSGIINAFRFIDKRIKVITQKNKGPGAARNAGIKEAIGEYIAFVDSDDYIDVDFFEKLYNACLKENAEIAAASVLKHKKFYTKYNILYKDNKNASDINSKIKLCQDKKGRFFCIWNKIYKASLIRNNNLFFPEDCYYEDVLFSIKALYYSNKIVSVPDIKYHYVQRNGSIINSKHDCSKKNDDRTLAYKELCFFAKKTGISLPKKFDGKNYSNKIFSISDFGESRIQIQILGLKFKFQKHKYSALRKQNPYYYYKKNNIDITTLPPAEGQIREIQLAGVYMLGELDYVCKKHNITYWLDFGALLGAVRHKGYIPWDDDIDIGIMREDYDRLIEVFPSAVRNPDLYLEYCVNETAQHVMVKMRHKKCMSLFLDIFPYDFYNAKLTDNEQIIMTNKCKSIREDFVKNLKYKDGFDFHEKFKELRKSFNNPDIEEPDVIWGYEFGHRWKKWIHSYRTFFPLKEIDFEGQKFPCINNYEKYLKDVYGDYMKYPKKISLGHIMYKVFSPEESALIKELGRH